MPFRFVAIKPKRSTLIDTKRLRSDLAFELNDFVTKVEDQMASYPSPPPASTYRRTGTLGRSWSVVPAQTSGSALVAKVGSNSGVAPYAKWVEGDQQSRVMAGIGWRKVMDVANKLWPGAASRIRAAFERAAGK